MQGKAHMSSNFQLRMKSCFAAMAPSSIEAMNHASSACIWVMLIQLSDRDEKLRYPGGIVDPGGIGESYHDWVLLLLSHALQRMLDWEEDEAREVSWVLSKAGREVKGWMKVVCSLQ
ncbi:unnamed protein product [Linum trigynum]|uniref:Uncharacterized protein n=1 Tax=Linum trigynum TaxID=586398 RepID=A0AAV2DWF1_9ROSI